MAEVAQELLPVSLEDEMQQSYLDYAMSVIVGRALPDVRDGLKPVHRRISVRDARARNDHEQGLQEVAPRVVGDVIGKYHPHGDSAVYDAIVRMAQHVLACATCWSTARATSARSTAMRAAAMRYTEVRMAQHRAASSGRHRQGNRRLPAELRRLEREPRSCRRGFRTCWSTARRASPSAWPPTFRRTTWAR